MRRERSAGARAMPRWPPRMLAVLTLLAFGCTDPQAPPARRAATGVEPSLAGAGRPLEFTTIDPPGSVSTTAMGIGASGDVVGAYTDAGQVTHGFLLSKGAYTIIDYPGAVYTEARGIGPNGEIVGAYRNAGEPSVNYHGFLRSADGTFTPVDYPGHTSTIAQRILPDGTIIGCYHDGDLAGSMHAVIFGRGGNEASAIFASMHDGATPSLHRIAGRYMDQATGENRGYLLENGVFTPLMAPGSSLTQAWDMNASGDIAGLYRDATGFHGFVLSRGEYTPLNVPGATHTRAYGINASGDIVGSYTWGTRTRGFIATRKGTELVGAPALTPCPATVPVPATCYAGTVRTGAPYLIALPENWDRRTLIIFAHGTATAASSMLSLGPASAMLGEGYAFAASDYRGPTPMAAESAEDTELLRQAFVREFGKMRRTVVYGLSYGGLVTARCAELYGVDEHGQRQYQGALVGCGLVAGTLRTYYTRIDTRLVYQYYCNNLPRPAEYQYPLYLGLDPTATMTLNQVLARVNECTGVNLPPSQRTAQQSQNLANITSVLRIPASGLPAMMQAATVYIKSIVADRLAGRNPFPNIGVRYTGSSDDDALNAGVPRVVSDPATAAMVAAADDPTGQVAIPVLTIHAIDDPRAFIEQENWYRQRFDAAHTTQYLQQVPTTTGDHCGFTQAEWVGAMHALLDWIDTGAKPSKEEVAQSCNAAQGRYSGACRFDATYEPAPLESRMYPRQP